MRHAQSARTSNVSGGALIAVRSLLTLLIVIAATGVAVGYLGLDLGGMQLLFLAPGLATAAIFGLWPGIFVSVASLAAYTALIGLPAASWRIGSKEDLLNLVLFVGGAWITALYTDSIKRRQKTAQTLLEAGHTLSAHAEGPALGRFYRSVASRIDLRSRWPILAELGRAAASAGMVLAASAAALLVYGAMGTAGVTALLLVGVVATAAMFGAPYAYFAAVLATLAQDVLGFGAPWTLHLNSVEDLLHLFIFGGVAAWVGGLSDQQRDERRAIQTLLGMGSALSAATEEAPLRSILFDALVRATRGGSVLLTDETGKVQYERIGGRPPPSIDQEQLTPNQTLEMGVWRIRRMSVDGRDVGVVSWRLRPLPVREHLALDQVMAAIADLGASAILRARLNAEKAEMEFIARTEQLRTLLLDAVSHHFRTPLTSIVGSVTNLLDQGDRHDGRARREFLLIIKEQANRLNRYVENFLSVARLESGSINIRPRAVDLEPLLYDVWESFGESGGARRFLDVQLADVPVLADPAPLKQVLGNILENAIKFSAEDSVVSVRSAVHGSHAVLEVADEGCGVPAADQDRIFERFFRSRGAKAPGLGLGLYITKSLVELMDGEIESSSRPDGRPGLVMSISLPLARAAA